MTILIVTNSNDPTADFAIEKFKNRGIPFIRLNTDKFLTEIEHNFNVQTGLSRYFMNLKIHDVFLDAADIKSVWFRRPEDPVPDVSITFSEAQRYCTAEANYVLKCLYQLLEDKIWVSHPKNISYANVKLHQLEIARKLGFIIPKSLCTNNPTIALQFISEIGDVVVKPFKVNVIDTGETTAVIYTSKIDSEAIENIASIQYAPTFFQEEIPKIKEYRVTIFGKDAFVTSIDSQSDQELKLDWRRLTNKPKAWVVDNLPDEVIKKCFTMIDIYGLNYGAFDFALTPNGEIVFFELNPNGQWAWQEIYLDIPMTAALTLTLGY